MFDEWQVANWVDPDVEMRVETAQNAVADGTPRPGTWSNPIPFSSLADADPVAGRLAPRWLHDLYMGMLADRDADTGDLFARCEHLPDRLSLTDASARPPNGHELLSIDIQCPEATVKSQLISCICRHCKYHFLFHFEQDSAHSCATPDGNASNGSKSLVCHLVLADLKTVVPAAEDVFNPVTQLGLWRCSAPTCSFGVTVSVSKPRMKLEHIRLVVDEKRIARQRQQAIEMDPVRFDPHGLKADMEYTALSTLNAYLRDCLGKTVDEPPKRIATRNKRFYIQFGASCSHIFEYLGLRKEVIEDEEYWFLPELKHYADEKTPIGSQRAFIEDARSEIQALIEEQVGQQSGGSVVKPWTEALYKLKRALNCVWWDTTNGKKPQDDDADFRILGTMANSNEGMLKYAYQRQVEADPLRRKLYCDALQRLASQRSVDLQIFTATEASLVEQMEASLNTPLAQAYTHFNLPGDCADQDDFVLKRYKVFCEQSPAQRVQHRQKLFLIGYERKSKALMEEALNDFSFEEACDYLQLESGVKDGNAPDMAVLDYYVEQAVEVSILLPPESSSVATLEPGHVDVIELADTPVYLVWPRPFSVRGRSYGYRQAL
jgi:ubiquitin carboxyl-terminal hydrolase 25/28